MGIVLCIQGPVWVLPIWILLECRVDSIVKCSQTCSVPVPVRQDLSQQNRKGSGDFFTKLLKRSCPVNRSLEDGQGVHFVLNFGPNLHAARTISDDRYIFAS